MKRTLAMKMQIITAYITMYTYSLSCNKIVKKELNRLVPFYARDDFVDKNKKIFIPASKRLSVIRLERCFENTLCDLKLVGQYFIRPISGLLDI